MNYLRILSEDMEYSHRWGVYRIIYSAGHLPQDGDPIVNYAFVDTDVGVSFVFDNVEYSRQNPFKFIEFKVEIQSEDYEFSEDRILKSLRDKAIEFHENDPAISYIVPIKHFSEKNEAVDYAKEQNDENENQKDM